VCVADIMTRDASIPHACSICIRAARTKDLGSQIASTEIKATDSPLADRYKALANSGSFTPALYRTW
jgi:hypothetical protein